MTVAPGVDQEPQPKLASRRPRRHERLTVRISAEQKTLFERAAALEGRSLTDFVVASTQAAAAETVQRHEVISLTMRDRAALLEALANPPAPNEALREAARRYRDLVSE